jgi:site-specific DNA recombinase
MAAQQSSGDKRPVMRAWYLLRVSSQRQMHTATDIDPEGNSIPTQRKHCDVKRKELGAIKVGETIEPGKSGQSMEKRPDFLKLLKRIDEEGGIDCVIIYARSRAFRNPLEAAIVKQQLDKRGVKLISANPTEDFGEGYMAEAMELITDVFNWVQVKQSGEDIKRKMANKAQNGGTIGRAPVGYLNVRVRIDGRDVNTIEVDDKRSPYIVMAWELAASGKFSSVDDIRRKITEAGLLMPSGKPISLQQMYNVLQDPYYCGYVVYKGIRYAGRHTPLISEELFERARKVLETHQGTGTRQRSHPHYLKGDIWCHRCKGRFVIQRADGNGGVYFYFFCTGRQDHICDHPYVPVEVMERAVVNHYPGIRLPETFRNHVTSLIADAAASNNKLSDDMRDKIIANLAKLDKKENYFLNLAAEEEWDTDKLRDNIAAIREERKKIERTLEKAETRLDDGVEFLTRALELMADPHAMYQAGGERVRAIMNRTIFAKLYIDVDTVADHELNQPFDALTAAYSQWQGYPHQTDTSPRPRATTGATGPRSQLHATLPAQRSSAAPGAGYGATELPSISPDLILAGQGSNKTHMVGDTGIEPVTSSV